MTELQTGNLSFDSVAKMVHTARAIPSLGQSLNSFFPAATANEQIQKFHSLAQIDREDKVVECSVVQREPLPFGSSFGTTAQTMLFFSFCRGKDLIVRQSINGATFTDMVKVANSVTCQ